MLLATLPNCKKNPLPGHVHTTHTETKSDPATIGSEVENVSSPGTVEIHMKEVEKHVCNANPSEAFYTKRGIGSKDFSIRTHYKVFIFSGYTLWSPDCTILVLIEGNSWKTNGLNCMLKESGQEMFSKSVSALN